MNRYFCILTMVFLILSCNQKTSQIEKEYIKNLEEKNRVLEKELQEIKSRTDQKYTPERKDKNKISKDFFTIGSTVDEVLEVMGDPTTYIDFGASGKRFNYGLSTVFFTKGKVESYNNVEENLRVKVKQ